MEKKVGHVFYMLEMSQNICLVVVAMSGGVDSSVMAALLAQDVSNVTVQYSGLTGKK